MINKSKLLISAFFAALIFLFMQTLYVFALPKVINIPSKTGKIEQLLKEKTSIDAKITNPTFRTYGDFSFEFGAEKIDFQNSKKQNLISADDFLIKIQPLQLLFRKLELRDFKAKDLFIHLERFDKNIFGLGEIIRIDITADPKLYLKHADINNYNVSVDDKYTGEKIVLRGKIFDVKPLKHGLSDLKISGEIFTKEKCAEYNLNLTTDLSQWKKNHLKDYGISGYIRKINLRQLEAYLKTLPNIDYSEGFLNLEFKSKKLSEGTYTEIKASADNLVLNKGIYEKQLILKGKSSLTLKLNTEKKVLTIKELLFKGNNIIGEVSGKIYNYYGDKPKLNLNIDIPKSRSEDIVNMLPYGICQEINLIKKYGISGDVHGFLKIKGEIPEPKIYGKVDGTNLHALRNIENTHTGKIGLLFEGKKIKITVDLLTKSSQTFNLKGIIDTYDKDWSTFNVKTSDKLELTLVRAILVPVSEIFDFIVGPLPIVNIKAGTGGAVLDIKGIKKTAYINGFVKLNNTTGSFDGISALLTKVNAIIGFKHDKIDFSAGNFLVNSYPADLSGHCDTDDGLFDFSLTSKNTESSVLLDIIKKSDMLNDIKNTLKNTEKISGKADFHVKVSGKIEDDFDFKTIDINKFKAEGFLNLIKNRVKLSDFSYPIERVSGKIDFNEKNIVFENMKFGLGKSSNGIISGKADISADKDLPMEIKIYSPSMEMHDSLNFAANSNFAVKYDLKQYNADIFNAKYSLDFSGIINGDEIDLKTAAANIKFLGKADNKNKNYISSGEISIKNNTATIKDFKARIGNSDIFIRGSVTNLDAKFPSYNLVTNSHNLDLSAVADFIKSGVLGTEAKEFIKKFKEFSGNINADLKITDRGSSGQISFKDLGFRHIQSDIPVFFPKFDIKLTNNKIFLNKITGDVGRTGKIPVFIDLIIGNYMKIPYLQGKIMTRINPVFLERYLNTKMTQPVKLIGNIDFSTEINGSVDSLRIFSVADIPPESDISYMAANLGDTDCLRELINDTYIYPDRINIKKFEYLKSKSQNSKNIQIPLLLASGIISRKNFVPQSFSVETKQKLPAKMLNFIFGKSLIKNGTFDASLKYFVPPKLKLGKPLGAINVYETEIPSYGAVINNAKIKFGENNVKLISSGSVISTDYSVNADMVNSLILPIRVKNINLNTKYLNLDNCISTINKWSIDAYMKSSIKKDLSFNISDIIIDKGVLNVDNIDYKSVPMTGLSSKISIDTNSLLKIDVENLKMADGQISSAIKYRIKDGSATISMTADGVDSNVVAESFMGLKNQIQGKFTGNINLKTKGFDSFEQLGNLSGNAAFRIKNGNMPKLGSLEYLLHATNLLKSGLTALSVNGVIELLNPFKDGSFEQINGKFDIDKGIVKNIEVFSKGSHLSIYLNGLYDMNESNADIVVYGKFGRKIEGHLGGVGNLSLNTFFNMIPKAQDSTVFDADISKIPDVTYKSDDYRVFRATVEGDINETNFVSSFKWIK